MNRDAQERSRIVVLISAIAECTQAADIMHKLSTICRS